MTTDKAMVTYDTLRAANIARQQEWDAGNQLTMAYRGNELAGEVGEACNLIKKIERERLGIRGSRATREQLAEELADVIICTDLVAMSEGIDLDAAVSAKFNMTSEKVGLSTRLSSLTLERGEAEPVAAMVVDHTGCEHMSRDIAQIERIADDCGERPTYLYSTLSKRGEAEETPAKKQNFRGLEQQIEAAREFVKRHPALTLIDLAEFEAFLKVPAAMEAALATTEGSDNG